MSKITVHIDQATILLPPTSDVVIEKIRMIIKGNFPDQDKLRLIEQELSNVISHD